MRLGEREWGGEKRELEKRWRKKGLDVAGKCVEESQMCSRYCFGMCQSMKKNPLFFGNM